MKKNYITILALFVSIIAVNAQNLWGVDASVDVANAEFQNNFIQSGVAGSYSTTSWTALSIHDTDGARTPGAAYWTRSTSGISQGAYATGMAVVGSPSQVNGVAIFDSDFMDNAGVANAFGTGTSPSSNNTGHKGELISPRIDLTGNTDSALAVKFYSLFRPFAVSELSVSFSSDDGATWGSSIDYLNGVGTNITSTQGFVTVNLPVSSTQGVSDLTKCRIKFTFIGQYYFAIVDDVTVKVADDLTAPVFENSTPSSASIATTGFTLNTDLNEAGTIYYVVVADGATAPTSAEVKAGTGNGGSGQITSGNAAVSTGSFTNAFSVTGLSAGTAYDVYVVAQDEEGTPNLQATPTKIDVTTNFPAGTITTIGFSNETVGSTTFTSNCNDFTVTGNMFTINNQFSGAGDGWYIDNAADSQSDNNGVSVSFKGSKDFRMKSVWKQFSGIGISTNENAIITGKINNAVVFSVTLVPNVYNATSVLNFSNLNGIDYSQFVIDEIVFSGQNDFESIVIDDFKWETVPDTALPTLSEANPVDNSAGVSISNDLTLTFNECIAFGTGNIQVIDVTDASNSFTIDAASPGGQASIIGKVLTINPSSNLDYNSNYVIQIAATAIDDISGNSYAGITNNTTLGFNTESDTTKPVITGCAPTPANTNINGSCEAAVLDLTGGVTATDNSGVAPVITQSPVAGATLGLGTTLITITATDGAGNKATCTVNQTVVDSTKPSVTCPGNQIETPNGSGNYILPDYTGLVVATDNCGIPTVTQSPVAGTVITATTTITMTVTDGSSNSDTCTFDVILPDNTAPVFENSTPSSSSITETGFTLNTDIDEAGTIYYIVVADEATAPTSAEVKAGTGSGGAGQVTSGSAVVSSGDFTNAFSVTGLTGNTAYDVYVVAQDDHGTPNLQASPTKVDVTTQTGFTVVESGGSTSTNENGTTDTFTVVLNSQPNSNVVIDVSSGDATEGSVDKSTLTFSTGNWNVAQTVTVTGLDDGLRDGNPSYNVTLSINAALTDDTFDGAANQIVSVTNFDNEITAASAGADQNVCGASTSLGGNTSSAGESGTWSIISGTGGSFSDANSPTSNFSGTINTAYTLRWTIDNGGVSESTDDVVITLFDNPTVAAAGPDQNNIAGTATLAANTITGLNTTGTWTQVAGPGVVTFGDANSNISIATVTVIGNYTFRWTSSNGVCPTSTDDVVVTYTSITPKVSFANNSSTGAESVTSADIPVNLSQASTQTVTIDYSITGTATAGTDYTLANGTLTFTPGSTSEDITIASIINDMMVEADETVIVTLSNATNANLGTNTSHTYTITNDDNTVVTITNVSANEDSGKQNIVATLSNPVQGGFTFEVFTTDGTAKRSENDYTSTFGTVNRPKFTFAGTAGETQALQLLFGGKADTKVEADETFTIGMDRLANTTLSATNIDITGVATFTILNDDTAYISIEDVSGNEDDGQLTLTATLDNPVDGGFKVNVNFTDGTATTADNDYTTASPVVLTFAGSAGETQTFTVTPTVDTKSEPNEILYIGLSNLIATIVTSNDVSTSAGAEVTILDDDIIPSVITFADLGKTYGDANFNLGATSNSTGTISYSIVGTANGTSLSGTNNATVSIGNTGVVTIRATLPADGNYSAQTKDVTLTINKATLTATADDKSREYGDANPAFTISYAGFKNSETVSVLDTAPTVTSTAIATTNAGSATITISGGNDNNYAITTVNGTLSISKATLIVTAKNTTVEYGDTFSIDFEYGAFKNGEDASVLDTGAYVYIVGDYTNAGTYTIVPDAVVDNNYTPSYVNGTLTKNKATLTATVDDKSREYGAANPAFTITYSGFKGSDSASDLDTAPTATSTATTTTAAGTAAITASVGTDNNYTITTVNGTLTIGKATLTATADDKSREYGAANPAFTITYSGFKGSDSASDLDTAPTATSTATTTTAAGTTAITASVGTDNNYIITTVNGTLTIGKATLTATADDKSREYGAANPAFTVTYSGFKGSDSASDLDTAPTATSTATTTTAAGTAAITASVGTDNNYTITTVNGTLTIGKATLVATADDQTKVFGNANPALTISYDGFKNSDTSADLDTAPLASTTANTSTAAGTVSIDLSAGTDANYTIVTVNGTLTILADNDGDGDPDITDTDDDNDGVLDTDDNSYLPNPDQADSNNNGIGDVQEDCDNDDILNYYDTDNTSCQEGIIMKKKYGFSPNGDGVNDGWVIENIALYPNNVVRIYNRSGKVVFEKKGYDNTWKGFSNKTSSGKKLPVGAYYFTVEFNTPGAKPAKGWIYINY